MHAPHRIALRRRFNRLDSRYEQGDFLYKELRDRLLARLQVLATTRANDFKPQSLLDLGAARGELARAAQKIVGNPTVVAIDMAEQPLKYVRGSWRDRSRHWFSSHAIDAVCADVQQLPIRSASIDLIVSSGLLHHCYEPGATLNAMLGEVRRVLSAGGALAFTTFGPNTLRELRRAWHEVDQVEHVQSFFDLQSLGDLLLRTGFADPVLDSETLELHYSSFNTLLAELRATGAGFWPGGAPRGLGNRQQLRALQLAYESQQANELRVTVEIIHGLVWQPVPIPNQQRPGAQPGETLIPLAALRSRSQRN
jgi:malonyl-CoA O-methyltransferase